MRRTFGYLAQRIIARYMTEIEVKEQYRKLLEDADKEGKYMPLYEKLGNDHASKADALLKIIMDEKLATPEEITQINMDCIAIIRGKEE